MMPISSKFYNFTSFENYYPFGRVGSSEPTFFRQAKMTEDAQARILEAEKTNTDGPLVKFELKGEKYIYPAFDAGTLLRVYEQENPYREVDPSTSPLCHPHPRDLIKLDTLKPPKTGMFGAYVITDATSVILRGQRCSYYEARQKLEDERLSKRLNDYFGASLVPFRTKFAYDDLKDPACSLKKCTYVTETAQAAFEVLKNHGLVTASKAISALNPDDGKSAKTKKAEEASHGFAAKNRALLEEIIRKDEEGVRRLLAEVVKADMEKDSQAASAKASTGIDLRSDADKADEKKGSN